jgi:hypothetical protein
MPYSKANKKKKKVTKDFIKDNLTAIVELMESHRKKCSLFDSSLQKMMEKV